MEPVTTAIVTAISSGGTFVLREVASQGVKDAYVKLKEWIKSRHPGINTEQIEAQPTSAQLRKLLGDDLEREGALTPELLKLAQNLLQIVREQPQELRRSVGVDLRELEQANVTFGKVLAGNGSTGVKIEKVRDSTLLFGDVISTAEADTLKKD